MKKIFLLLVVVLTAASYTHAQTVVVNKNDGTSVTFNASDIKSIEFSPVAENTIEGSYTGKNSLKAFGMGPYNVENATYTISKNADGTINVTSSKETYTGTPMGDIVLDTYTISNLAFDAAKNAYFRDYRNDGIKFTCKLGILPEKQYEAKKLGNMTVSFDEQGGVTILNNYQLGTSPAAINATFTGKK